MSEEETNSNELKQEEAEQLKEEFRQAGVLKKTYMGAKALFIPWSKERRMQQVNGSGSGSGSDEGQSLTETQKDVIASTGIDLDVHNGQSLQLGQDYLRVFQTEWFNERPDPHYLNPLTSSPFPRTDVSIHLNPFENEDDAVEELRRREQELNEEPLLSNIQSLTQRAEKQQQVEALKEDVLSGDRLFRMSMYTGVRSRSRDELPSSAYQVKGELETSPIKTVQNAPAYAQLETAKSLMPLASEQRDKKRYVNAGGVAHSFPFASKSIIEPNGFMFGVHEFNRVPIIYDPFDAENGFNRLTLGKIGAGKSFTSKLHILRALSRYEDLLVFMIDPLEDDFYPFNEILGGKHIPIGGSRSVNPLHIEAADPETVEERNLDPFREKLNEVSNFFSMFFDMEDTDLSTGADALLGDLIEEAYRDKGITEDPQTHTNDSPTIKDILDLTEEVIETPSKFADYIEETEDSEEDIPSGVQQSRKSRQEAAVELREALSPFTSRYSNLAEPNDIDFSEEDIMYLDLSSLEGQDDTSIMTNVVFSNAYEKAKATDKKVLFVIDEAHYLLQNDDMAARLETVVRHSRHYDMSMNFVTQELSEFLQKESTRTIARNISTKLIHKMDSVPDEAAEVLDLTPAQVERIRSLKTGSEGASTALFYIDDYDGYFPLELVANNFEQTIVDVENDEVEQVKQQIDTLVEDSKEEIDEQIDQL